MKHIKTCPHILKMKTLLTFTAGAACLFVGGAWYLCVKDGVFLAISGLLFLFSLLKAISLYQSITAGQYEVIEGICEKITLKPFCKYRTVKVVGDTGAESTLRLDNHTKIKMGRRYRFYFSKSQNPSLGSAWLDSALSAGQFLGCEEIESGDRPAANGEAVND